MITSKEDACCGGKLKFEVATYFQATHNTLFDWAETDVDLSVGITNTFTASTGIEVDTTGFTKLVIAFKKRGRIDSTSPAFRRSGTKVVLGL